MAGAGEEFTCEGCKGTFVKGWTDEEALAEYASAFPVSAAAGVDTGLTCDDCYAQLVAWAKEEGLQL